MNRLERIRWKEKEYHDHCYLNYSLFEEGSWLHKPAKNILDLFEMVENRLDVSVLDLGCGVGRNSIPLARRLNRQRGRVVCVDLLESAIRVGLDPMYECMFETEYLLKKFARMYSGWNMLKQTVKPYEIEINRDEKKVLLQGDVVTWAVQKPIVNIS